MIDVTKDQLSAWNKYVKCLFGCQCSGKSWTYYTKQE